MNSWLKENWFKVGLGLLLVSAIFSVGKNWSDNVSNTTFRTASSSSLSATLSLTESEGSSDADADPACNVTGINLHGTLLTYESKSGNSIFGDGDVVSSESIIAYINGAQSDDAIKAILIEVDSSGGLPVAGEEIANALKASTKPTAAFIRQTGASAAYWAVSSAGRIFASKNSDVGGIGVTESYLEDVSKNQKEGYGFVQLNAGKYKDIGNPSKPLTEEEKAILLRDLNIVYQNFIEDVSANRKIPLDEVKKMADGSTVLGEKAKSLRLIDEIGSYSEAEKYLSGKIGGKAKVCWY